MHAIVHTLAAVAIGAALSTSAATSLAAEQGVSCTGLGHAEKRVLEHAHQGIDALRRYVIITRPVHGLSMVDIVESLDDWRAKAQCTRKLAAEAPAAVAQAKH